MGVGQFGLNRKHGGRKEDEKVHGVHQLSSPAGDEEWKVRPWLQTVPEDDPSGKSQAGHPGQQLPCSQNLRSSTMLCWLRLVSTTTVETTLSLAQPVASTIGCAHWQSSTLAILTSSGACQISSSSLSRASLSPTLL